MKRVLKWIGYIVGTLVALILVAVGTVYAVTSSRMGKTYSTNVPTIAIPTDSASIARGQHLAISVGKCQACHGDNWGGKIFSNDAAFAKLTTPNLTRGKDGIGATYTDVDWVRALRYGIGRNGKSLVFMPAESYTHFSDTDLGQVIAYLKTLPPADLAVTPMRSPGPVMRILYLTVGFPMLPASIIDHNMQRPAVAEGPTKEYGEYLIKAGGCQNCHGANFGGGTAENMPVPNLTKGGELGKWSEADFAKAVRTGIRPDGRVLSAVMPWEYMKGLTDTEVSAMWAHLQSVPAVPLASK
jgi:mono/diheme cytochrome c family protein